MSVLMSQLWPAILSSGLLCWLASSLIHMLFKYHNADYSSLENEAEVASALGSAKPSQGLYTIPHCFDMKQMREDAMQKKFANGPVAMISVMPNGMPNMAKLLGFQLLFFIAGSALIAYLATLAIPASSEYINTFRFIFITGFLAYGWAHIPLSIWMGQR